MTQVAWQQFLSTQSASFDTASQASFANPVSDQQLYDLSHLGLIAVSGADAFTFLQGQLTNDIRQVETQAQFTGYCSPKGRLLGLFYAFYRDEVIFLQCPRNLIPDLIKRLRMFVLRSKVIIEDVSDQYVTLGLAAPDLAQALPDMPSTTHAIQAQAQGTLIRLHDAAGLQRGLQVVPMAQASAAWLALQPALYPASTHYWEALEIQAGIPQVYLPTKEQFVPQMVNLDKLDGINFKKGCYTGQEIVARTHYLGKVKRRALPASLPLTKEMPQVGDVILDAQQQEAGQLVRVSAAMDGSCKVLAECRLEARDSGPVTWQGQVLQFDSLPYTLE